MDKTRKYIAILEPSDIIFDGLYNLLMKNSHDCSVYRLNDIDEISVKYRNLDFSVVVINPMLIQNNTKNFIKTKKQHINIYWTGIVYSFIDDETLNVLDAYCKVTENSDLILDMIIKQNEKGNHKHENELTERETEVLKLMANGLSNKEIAKHLNISAHTVISHRKNLIEKTGIKSLSGLTIYAITKKIIPLHDK